TLPRPVYRRPASRKRERARKPASTRRCSKKPWPIRISCFGSRLVRFYRVAIAGARGREKPGVFYLSAMLVSQYLLKTLRESPSGAELPSHIFLLRGGYVKPLASGLYSVLPLGKRVLNKIEALIRDEMEKVGGQEVDLPLVQPAELWMESGRYGAIGAELLRFQDRSEHHMVL